MSISHAPSSMTPRPDFDDTLDIIVATVRGTVIIAAIPGADTPFTPPWLKLKEHLLAQVLSGPAPGVAVSPDRAASTN
ncbi:hypothetical protein ACWF82_06265 [Nocardia sp. NPDC055053]